MISCFHLSHQVYFSLGGCMCVWNSKLDYSGMKSSSEKHSNDWLIAESKSGETRSAYQWTFIWRNYNGINLFHWPVIAPFVRLWLRCLCSRVENNLNILQSTISSLYGHDFVQNLCFFLNHNSEHIVYWKYFFLRLVLHVEWFCLSNQSCNFHLRI